MAASHTCRRGSTGYGARWDGDECTLWAEGEIGQAAVFGENLVLRRRVEAKVGEDRLTIHDVVTNAVGFRRRTCTSITSMSAFRRWTTAPRC